MIAALAGQLLNGEEMLGSDGLAVETDEKYTTGSLLCTLLCTLFFLSTDFSDFRDSPLSPLSP